MSERGDAALIGDVQCYSGYPDDPGNFKQMRTSPLAPAALLCSVVLGTFFVLRNYGPESTVRRFHFAVIKEDLATLRMMSVGQDAAVYSLASKVKRLFSDRAKITLGRVNDDDPNRVVAQFIYLTPQYNYTINWVMVHQRSGWMVDAEATLNGPFFDPPVQARPLQ